ncbi:MAG: hypothetical protein IKZ29_04575 [Clostridiales bacterium]|nr:hypothetical protein [Clostridiales bacterium]
MYESIELLNELENLAQTIDKRIERITERIKNAPDGTLRISKTQNVNQYYHRKLSNDTLGKYIPRKDRSVAEGLAQKDYDIKLLEALTSQQKAIKQFLNTFDPDAAQQVFTNLTAARQALVTPEFLSDEEYIEQWMNEPYERLGFKKDDQEFYTAKGERVRSKSEILIADALLRNNIPYRLEFPVYDGKIIIGAPDFKCLNVRLRKDYYWEHLGKLGDEDYSNRNVKKLAQYTLADDFDETRLILTFETDKHPLNTKVIEAKIRRYLI